MQPNGTSFRTNLRHIRSSMVKLCRKTCILKSLALTVLVNIFVDIISVSLVLGSFVRNGITGSMLHA